MCAWRLVCLLLCCGGCVVQVRSCGGRSRCARTRRTRARCWWPLTSATGSWPTACSSIVCSQCHSFFFVPLNKEYVVYFIVQSAFFLSQITWKYTDFFLSPFYTFWSCLRWRKAFHTSSVSLFGQYEFHLGRGEKKRPSQRGRSHDLARGSWSLGQ